MWTEIYEIFYKDKIQWNTKDADAGYMSHATMSW